MKLIGYDSDYNPSPIPCKPPKNKKKRGTCCYCKQPLSPKNYTRDHIYPKSLGGRITKPCCTLCNQEKSNKTLIQYAQYIGKRMYAMIENGKKDTWGYKNCKTKMKSIERLMKLKADQQ